MQDEWTYDAFLKYAELAAKDSMTFGLGIGSADTNTDGIDQVGALFKAFGAMLVDDKGTMHLDSPEMTQCLEYWQKLVKFMPDDAVSYDDASNNRALISGKSALIFNPPSAWAVAKRDAPDVAKDCWTFSAPTGTEGSLRADRDVLLGHLAVQQEPDCGEGAGRVPDGASAGRSARQRGGRL